MNAMRPERIEYLARTAANALGHMVGLTEHNAQMRKVADDCLAELRAIGDEQSRRAKEWKSLTPGEEEDGA